MSSAPQCRAVLQIPGLATLLPVTCVKNKLHVQREYAPCPRPCRAIAETIPEQSDWFAASNLGPYRTQCFHLARLQYPHVSETQEAFPRLIIPLANVLVFC